MKVTIKEVAKEANVSPSTVSRVISDSPQISDKTKEKVREVINRLKYKPNAIARSLANNKSRIIGVVLPNEDQDLITNSFFIQAMKGMSEYAQKKKYYITYAFSEDEKSEYDNINNFITSNLVDGVCLLRARPEDKSIKYLQQMDFPFVVIGRPEEADGMLWVDNDNFQTTYNLVGELYKKGHRDISFIGAREEWNVTRDRLYGFKVACEMNRIPIEDKNIIMMPDFNEKDGAKAADILLENSHPTAIIVEDDVLAFGVLNVFKEKNITDISIIGFNNSPLAEFQTPKLSSVDINSHELGYYASKILIDYLEDNQRKINHYIVESKIIYRESFRE